MLSHDSVDVVSVLQWDMSNASRYKYMERLSESSNGWSLFLRLVQIVNLRRWLFQLLGFDNCFWYNLIKYDI